jgi:hypothetical protein
MQCAANVRMLELSHRLSQQCRRMLFTHAGRGGRWPPARGGEVEKGRCKNIDNCIIFSLKKDSLKSLSRSTSRSAYEPQRHTRRIQVCRSQRRGLASMSVPWASWMASKRSWPCYSNQMRAAETYLIGLIDLLVVHNQTPIWMAPPYSDFPLDRLRLY